MFVGIFFIVPELTDMVLDNAGLFLDLYISADGQSDRHPSYDWRSTSYLKLAICLLGVFYLHHSHVYYAYRYGFISDLSWAEEVQNPLQQLVYPRQ